MNRPVHERCDPTAPREEEDEEERQSANARLIGERVGEGVDDGLDEKARVEEPFELC